MQNIQWELHYASGLLVGSMHFKKNLSLFSVSLVFSLCFFLRLSAAAFLAASLLPGSSVIRPRPPLTGVDGLSGATLTSTGVQNTFNFWFGDLGFGPFLAKVRDGGLN